jgi:hypothetical protein
MLRDVLDHRVIADFLPHATRTTEVRKNDRKLGKAEGFGVRRPRHPISVNFDARPVSPDAGRVRQRSGDADDLLFGHHSH